MKKKKIAVIGRGTAGAMAMAEVVNKFGDTAELEWHFDSSIKTQAVGEGSTISVVRSLFHNLGFLHHDLDHIDGTFKHGIRKINWTPDNLDFFHEFTPPMVSYHFNAVALQNYVYGLLKDKVKVVDHNVTYDQLDASYIIDCSGKPNDWSLFDEPEYIPVNAAYVTQCYWDMPRFFYTLTIARPYGWVFGIPLKNRCSIGYMFNDKITSVEEVKEDVKHVFEQFNLIPSTTTNELHFKNYARKTNFIKGVAFNGNASFFLEPIEATTLTGVDYINSWACSLIKNPLEIHKFNAMYKKRQENIERMIMLHYFAGSTFKTDFWDFAYERARKCLEIAVNDDPNWQLIYEVSKTSDPKDPAKHISLLKEKKWPGLLFEDWTDWSYYENLSHRGMNLYDKIDALKRK